MGSHILIRTLDYVSNPRDFASAEFRETFENLEGTVFIPCAILCTFLNDAESKIDVKPRRRFRKRRRVPTPEEGLDTDDEENVAQAETRAAEKADRGDPSFNIVCPVMGATRKTPHKDLLNQSHRLPS
ncbi:hypothetical protein AYO22_11682 [Fonsecaea multimorphosa]|nr:hypothetical protein AYO22_11682 [Fonsecaea multimorphosa]